MTAHQPDTYTHNKGSFWLCFGLGLLLLLALIVVLLALMG